MQTGPSRGKLLTEVHPGGKLTPAGEIHELTIPNTKSKPAKGRWATNVLKPDYIPFVKPTPLANLLDQRIKARKLAWKQDYKKTETQENRPRKQGKP